MLADGELVAFVSARNLEVADGFYRGVLGLRRVESSEFAMAYDVNGTQLRVTRVETLRPAPFTVLGWLRRRGVVFERYEGLSQDEHDAWTAPGGSRVAWFSDPDGNLLSLQQAQA